MESNSSGVTMGRACTGAMGEVARTVAPAVKTPKKDLLVVVVVAAAAAAVDNEENEEGAGGGGGAQERTPEAPSKSADIMSVVDILMVCCIQCLSLSLARTFSLALCSRESV